MKSRCRAGNHRSKPYRPAGRGKTQAFVSFGAGLTWVDPRAGEFDSGLGGSILIGGGLRVPVRDGLAFRFDARGYLTFTETELEGRCGPDRCSIDFSGDGPFQLDLLAGVTFGF